MPGEPSAKAPGKPGTPAETPSTAGTKPSGPVSPKAGAEPAPPPGKPIEESPLPVYWLKGKTGELVPVPGFSLEDLEVLMSQKYRPEQAEAEKVPRYSLQAMSVSGAVVGERAELSVQFRFLVRDEQWVRIPLRLDQAVLRGGAKYRGPGQHFLHFETEGEGYVAWVRGGPGQEHQLTLDVLVPLAVVGDQTRLKLLAPRAASSEMKLSIPQSGLVARTSEGATLLGAASGPGETTSLTVLGLGGDFELSWRKGPAQPAGKPVVLEVHETILAKVDGQSIDSVGRLTVLSRGGPFDSFRVRLPKQAELLPADQPDYGVAALASGKPGAEEGRIVEVRFPRKLSGPVEVQLATRIRLDRSGAGGGCELEGYEVVGAARQSGYVAVAAGPLWQVLVGTARGARPIDELPEPLRREETVAAMECFAPSFSIPLRVVPRKTRVTVEPEYLIQVEGTRAILEARLKYRVQGGEVGSLGIELPQWKVESVGPESMVAGVGEPDGAGVLSIPLVQRLTGAAELTLRASRSIGPGARTISLDLPRPRADTQLPAAVVILPADDVELTPTPDGTVGLARQEAATAMKLPVRQQAPLVYRADPAKAVFAAGFAVHPQKVAVAVESRIALEEQKARVEQRIVYTISYRPMERLAVAVAAELVGAESLEILLDEKRVGLGGLASPEGDANTAGPVQHLIALPSPQIGRCEVVVRYVVETARLQPSADVRAAVPLVMPAEGKLLHNRVLVSAKEGIRVLSREGSWTAADVLVSRSPRRHALQLTTDQRTPQVVLDLHLEDQSALGTTVVHRAWVQTWLTGAGRQDRAVFSLTSSRRTLEVVVPAGVNPKDVELWLGDQPIKAQATPEGRLLVPLSTDGSLGRYRVEAVFRFPSPRPAPGLLALELPRLGQEVSVQRTYWQLVLPPKEHVVLPPASLSGEFSWGWNGLFWGRMPLLEQRQLERWCGARELTDVAGSTNRYLFSTLGPVDGCELRTAMRPLIVMAASGAALVLGLLLIYVPGLRHPAIFLVGAVGLGAAAAIYPEPALLLAQAASLGVVLTVLAGVFQGRAARRRVGPPREGSDAALERSSTQTHRRPPSPADQAPTETAPAAVPVPAAGPSP